VEDAAQAFVKALGMTLSQLLAGVEGRARLRRDGLDGPLDWEAIVGKCRVTHFDEKPQLLV
jgi:hypothetical protein